MNLMDIKTEYLNPSISDGVSDEKYKTIIKQLITILHDLWDVSRFELEPNRATMAVSRDRVFSYLSDFHTIVIELQSISKLEPEIDSFSNLIVNFGSVYWEDSIYQNEKMAITYDLEPMKEHLMFVLVGYDFELKMTYDLKVGVFVMQPALDIMVNFDKKLK